MQEVKHHAWTGDLKLKCGDRPTYVLRDLSSPALQARLRGSFFESLLQSRDEFRSTDWDDDGVYHLKVDMDPCVLTRVIYFLQHGHHQGVPSRSLTSSHDDTAGSRVTGGESLEDFLKYRAAFRYFNLPAKIGPQFVNPKSGRPQEIIVTARYLMTQMCKEDAREELLTKAPKVSSLASFTHTGLQVTHLSPWVRPGEEQHEGKNNNESERKDNTQEGPEENDVAGRSRAFRDADEHSGCVYLPGGESLFLDSDQGILHVRSVEDGLPTVLARHHLLKGRHLLGAVRFLRREVVRRFGYKRDYQRRTCELEQTDIWHWWIRLKKKVKTCNRPLAAHAARARPRQRLGPWMLLAWHSTGTWRCSFIDAYYEETKGLSLLFQISPKKELLIAEQDDALAIEDPRTFCVLLRAPVECKDVQNVLRPGCKKRKGARRMGPNRLCRGVSMHEASGIQRHAWQCGFKQMGSCLQGEMPQDIWIVRSGDTTVLVLHALDGRVAVATLSSPRSGLSSPRRVNTWPGKYRPAAQKFATDTLDVYLKSSNSPHRFKGYTCRIDVPRAVSIHAVLPSQEHILIYYKPTSAHRDFCVWRIDQGDRFEAVGLIGPAAPATPKTINLFSQKRRFPGLPRYWGGKKGESASNQFPKGKHVRLDWGAQWGCDSPPMVVPKDFFGDAPPRGAVVMMQNRQIQHDQGGEEEKKNNQRRAMDSFSSPPSTEVLRFSLGYRNNDLKIAQREHFLCTIPDYRDSECALGSVCKKGMSKSRTSPNPIDCLDYENEFDEQWSVWQ